ncbi:unnamed protein product [Lactuca saligna]|uniref:Uncharacterized protein n=1 Tax=Lactuca saligna TaxID=75948 RepID=A0AA35ZCI8_LACSI|nr:unnamed protein product [Lactuca saligna]
MQSIIAEADKPKKGGQKGGQIGPPAPKRRKVKKPDRKPKSPTPIESEHSHSDTQSHVRLEEDETDHNEEVTLNPEVTPTYNDFFPSPPHSPKTITTPITIAPSPPPPNYADTSGFTTTHISPPISPLRQNDPDMIYVDGEDGFAGFTFSPFTMRTQSNDEAPVTRGQLKAIHEKINILLQASKESSHDDYSKATAEKQVKDLLSERAVIKICITDITVLLSNIIETRDSMITITVRKHLAENLSTVFAMLHLLEGVPESSNIPKQGGDQPKKTLAKPIVKIESEPNGKEKFFYEEPIIDNSEDEELDEDELKKRKASEAKLDEHQRIV